MKTYLMNPHTGSVDTFSNWAADWHDRDIDDESTLDEWIESLIEVRKTRTSKEKAEFGEWIAI